MSFPREKRENEEFYDEKFLTRKTRREKDEKLTTLKLRFLGIYEAHSEIIKKFLLEIQDFYKILT